MDEKDQKTLPVQLACQTCWASSLGKPDFSCDCKRIQVSKIRMISHQSKNLFGFPVQSTSGLEFDWETACSHDDKAADSAHCVLDIDVPPNRSQTRCGKKDCQHALLVLPSGADHIKELRCRKQYSPRKHCKSCRGTGVVTGKMFKACDNCGGVGGIPCESKMHSMSLQPCNRVCKYRCGMNFSDVCAKCKGARAFATSAVSSWVCPSCYEIVQVA